MTIIYANFRIIDFAKRCTLNASAYIDGKVGKAFDFRAIWIYYGDNDVEVVVTWQPADPRNSNSNNNNEKNVEK